MDLSTLSAHWKSIADLKAIDLRASPVWEVRGADGQEFVRPVSVDLTEGDGNGPIYIAATRFVAANGLEFFGYCSPTESSGLDYTQPTALTETGAWPLWTEGGVSCSDVSSLVNVLGIEISELFPVKLTCLVEVDGVAYSEVIHLNSRRSRDAI